MDLSALLAIASGKKAEIAARSGNSNLAKIPPGTSRWRILPGWRPADELTFYHDFGQHWIKDRDGNVKGVFVCENATFGRPCEYCDGLNDLIRATKDDSTLKALKEMGARVQTLVNALRVDGSDANLTKSVILPLPGTVLSAYLGLLHERATQDGINILSLEAGRNITITRTGSGLLTKYEVKDAASNSAVDPEAMKNIDNIDAFIEAEMARGRSKIALFEPALKELLVAHGGVVQTLRPAGAIQVRPAARAAVTHTIEADEPAAEVAKAPAAPAATVAAKSATPVSDEPLDDAELNALLANL